MTLPTRDEIVDDLSQQAVEKVWDSVGYSNRREAPRLQRVARIAVRAFTADRETRRFATNRGVPTREAVDMVAVNIEAIMRVLSEEPRSALTLERIPYLPNDQMSRIALLAIGEPPKRRKWKWWRLEEIGVLTTAAMLGAEYAIDRSVREGRRASLKREAKVAESVVLRIADEVL